MFFLFATYDYAGASNAVNPGREAAVLLGTFWALELISKLVWFQLRRLRLIKFVARIL